MPIKPFVEEPKKFKSGSFTGSIVITNEIDKYRQGNEYFDTAHPKYGGVGVIKIRKQDVDELSQWLPRGQSPRRIYEDAIEDTTEPVGFWNEGFIEPLTIRDEVTFNSIDSPIIAHSIKANVSDDTALIEQKELKNEFLKRNQNTFLESGSIVRITTTSTIYNAFTTSLSITDVEENFGNIKRSTAAGYDYSFVIITGSKRSPTIRAIYKDKDSIAFRDRAANKGRQLFLLSDSTFTNLSGTAFNFESAVKTSLSSNIQSFHKQYAQNTNQLNYVKTPYPPILRENTDFKGKREWTFIDSAPSGVFPTFIREARGARTEITKSDPGSIYENNRRGGALVFKEIYNQDIGFPGTGSKGNRDPRTGEWANTILRFNLTQSSRRFVLIGGDIATANVATNTEGYDTSYSTIQGFIQTDTNTGPQRLAVYDFMGSSEGDQAVLNNPTTPGWFLFKKTNTTYWPMLMDGHYQLATSSNATSPIAGISLLTNTVKAASSNDFNRLMFYLKERSYKFDFPFIIKRVSIDAEIFAANSAAFVGVGTASLNLTRSTESYINWTFQPTQNNANGTVLALTSSGAVVVQRSVQAPHATFMIVKSLGSYEQARGRDVNFNVANADMRLPIGIAINGRPQPITQILLTASIGLHSSSVSTDEQTNYPRFDYGIRQAELSGTGGTTKFWLTRTISIVKEPAKRFNITASRDSEADFQITRDLSVMSSQLNFINKGDSIHFMWSPAGLSFGNELTGSANSTAATRIWNTVFGIRDVFVSIEGYIPRNGQAIQDSLNQNLTTQAIHENIHEVIHDQFDTFFSAAFTGAMISRFAHPSSSSPPWFNGGIDTALKAMKIIDSSERFFDTGIKVLTGTVGMRAGSTFFSPDKVVTNSRIFSGELAIIGDFNEYIRNHIRLKPVSSSSIAGTYVTRSVGYRFGIYSTSSINNEAIFRFNKFGNMRDMLEPRKYGRLVGVRINEATKEEVTVNTFAVAMSSSTKNLGQNPQLTASAPYVDGRAFTTARTDPLGGPYKGE